MSAEVNSTTPPPRQLWPWLAALAAALGLFFLIPDPEASSSSLSRATDGWWAMRSYLEARGAEVELLDAPLAAAVEEADATEAGLLVLALPWQYLPNIDLESHLRQHLRSGGNLLLAYDSSHESSAQTLLFEAFGLMPMLELRDDPPLSPIAWWRYRKQHMALRSTSSTTSSEAAPELELPALRYVPFAPTDAKVFYATDDGAAPVIFELERYQGRILALPAELFTNAQLAENGHADYLEALLGSFDGPWRFDEYHHGLIRAELIKRSAASYAWDLFILHLALLYVLALIAAGRRFGPAWRESKAHTGSTSDFLRSLGVLHHQLGHHRDAARQLLARVRRLEPRIDSQIAASLGTDTLDPDAVENSQDLIDFAATLSDLRHPRSSSAKG